MGTLRDAIKQGEEPFIVDLKSSTPTLPADSLQQRHFLVFGSHMKGEKAMGLGERAQGFPGITLWKREEETQRRDGGVRDDDKKQPDPRNVRKASIIEEDEKKEELLYYNRTGTGLSCRLWHHWQQQHHYSDADVTVEQYSGDEVTEEQTLHAAKGRIHMIKLVSLEDPAEKSPYRQASEEETAEDENADKEVRYKYEGKDERNELRILAASLSIVYDDRWVRKMNHPTKDGSLKEEGIPLAEESITTEQQPTEEEVRLRVMADEEEEEKGKYVTDSGGYFKFLHLAPLIQSSLNCAGTLVPHQYPKTSIILKTIANSNEEREVASFLMSSAIGLFLLMLATFYLVYFF